MQSNRSGFAYETPNFAFGKELEGHEHRNECEITAGHEIGAQHSRQSDGRRQVVGVQAVRSQRGNEKDHGRG